MCAEPKTAEDAANKYWFDVGFKECESLVMFMGRQKQMVEHAFTDGAQWERTQLRRFAAALDAHAPAGERSE